MPEVVEADKAFHLIRSCTGRYDALLLAAEKMIHVVQIVLWSVVSELDFGGVPYSLMAQSRCLDPIYRNIEQMPEKASRLVHYSESPHAKVPEERTLDDRHMQVPHFEDTEPWASSADLLNVAVAEVVAAVWCTEDFGCFGSQVDLQTLLVTQLKKLRRKFRLPLYGVSLKAERDRRPRNPPSLALLPDVFSQAGYE